MTQNSEPWFVRADVCKVLGISRSITDTKTRLDQRDISTIEVLAAKTNASQEAVTRSTVTITQVNGSNESGLDQADLDSIYISSGDVTRISTLITQVDIGQTDVWSKDARSMDTLILNVGNAKARLDQRDIRSTDVQNSRAGWSRYYRHQSTP